MLDLPNKSLFSFSLVDSWSTNVPNNLSGTKGQESRFCFLEGNKHLLLPTPNGKRQMSVEDRCSLLTLWGRQCQPAQLAFLILSHSAPVQNTGTMQYWCAACEAFCSQILCSPQFVWYSCWGNWLQDGQPLNLGTSSCGSHYWIALLGSAAFFLRASNFWGFIVKSLNCPGVPVFMAMLFYYLTYSAHVTAAAVLSFICVP